MRLAYNASRNKKKDHYNKLKRIRAAGIREQVREWKHEHGCTYCDENDPCCLDLHHTDSNQKENEVSNLMGRSFEGWLREANKCIVVCANCHRKIHATENRV
jgi:hypothetical protein